NENKILKTVRRGYNLTEDYFAIDIRKATAKKDVTTVLNLVQLTNERYKDFYVDTDKVRYGHTIFPLEQALKDPLSPYIKRFFSGITGSGKTMELIKLCFRLQDDFNVIIFSVLNKLRSDDITIKPLLFEIIGDLLEYIYSNRLADKSNKTAIKNRNIGSLIAQTMRKNIMMHMLSLRH
ncbi:MAG: hypothetical protein MUF15_18450, partial [Acidobacteria bacterium]|nr:hypothetical protein [Acidobacteriota bacterium]